MQRVNYHFIVSLRMRTKRLKEQEGLWRSRKSVKNKGWDEYDEGHVQMKWPTSAKLILCLLGGAALPI